MSKDWYIKDTEQTSINFLFVYSKILNSLKQVV
jgi:hypothetical protein